MNLLKTRVQPHLRVGEGDVEEVVIITGIIEDLLTKIFFLTTFLGITHNEFVIVLFELTRPLVPTLFLLHLKVPLDCQFFLNQSGIPHKHLLQKHLRLIQVIPHH